MTETISDRQILDEIAARCEDGLRRALRDHGPSVLGIARHVVRDASTAEEVAQDTFLALWNGWQRVDLAKGTLRSFLVTVARRKAIDRVRANEAWKRAMARERPEGIEDERASHDTILQRIDLAPALQRLTHVQREALALAYFGGRTYREVAQELGIPEGTAKTRLRDGLNALRRDLADTV